MNKYRNKKIEVDGILFDSQKEANRYMELKLLQRVGMIKDLRLQVPFQIIPKVKDETTGKVVQREAVYVADFTYWQNGKFVVEDAKGFRTDAYKLKKKLMRYVHGIEIQEV